MSYQWSFIGAGNMAGSIIGGLVASGSDAGTIAVHDIDDAAVEKLTARHGIAGAVRLNELFPTRGIVIAVKPDTVESVCSALKESAGSVAGDSLLEETLFMSIAAGVRSDAMAHWLPAGAAIVRCMPNTPALLGLGASAIFANRHCSDAQRNAAHALMQSVGEVVEVENESDLDIVTALSGSGPAYVFFLMEQMAAVGAQLGLSADVARRLAIQTARGAAAMAHQGDDSPSELRTKVTSKGGTTAAAIEALETGGFAELVEKAMQAARARAIEMGEMYSPDR